MDNLCLGDLSCGEQGIVTKILAEGIMRRRLQDIGFIVGTKVKCLGYSPFGDPGAYLIRGAIIALRRSDAACVVIRPLVQEEVADE